MAYEHSAGAVVFRRENGQIRYLILHYQEGHWGCSKGHTENAETVEETARREVREETGLIDIRFIPGFEEINRYSFMGRGGRSDGRGDGRIDKTVTFLLAESGSSRITLSDEHIDFAWLPFEQALARITFKNEKELFQKAHQLVTSLK